MQNHKTPEEVKTAVLERKLAILENEFKKTKSVKIQYLLKELRDLDIDNLICIYIEAKLKKVIYPNLRGEQLHLPEHTIAAIEDLEDLIHTFDTTFNLYEEPF
jgi:acetoacetate decarboxylase